MRVFKEIFKEKNFHIFIYVLIFLGLLWLFAHSAFSQKIIAPITPSTDESELSGIIYTDVIQYNVAYLSLSILIIVLIGGIFYLFNLRPLQESIEEQDRTLKNAKQDLVELQSDVETKQKELQTSFENKMSTLQLKLEEKFTALKDEARNDAEELDKNVNLQVGDSLSSLEAQLNGSLADIDKKVEELRTLAEQIEMSAKWSEHYMWGSAKVYVNSLMSLVLYLELGLKYNRTFLFQLCLERISYVLGKMTKTQKQDPAYPRLLAALEKIKGFDEEKKKVKDQAASIFTLD